MVDFVVNSV